MRLILNSMVRTRHQRESGISAGGIERSRDVPAWIISNFYSQRRQRGLAREQDGKRDLAIADYKLALARDRNLNEPRQALARLEAAEARERKLSGTDREREKNDKKANAKSARDAQKAAPEAPVEAAKTTSDNNKTSEPAVTASIAPAQTNVVPVPPQRQQSERTEPVREKTETKARELEQAERTTRDRDRAERNAPDRKTMSSAAKQREIEDKKREKEARARRERMQERQQAERKAERLAEQRRSNSQPDVRYYRAGSPELRRGPRFTDVFNDNPRR